MLGRQDVKGKRGNHLEENKNGQFRPCIENPALRTNVLTWILIAFQYTAMPALAQEFSYDKEGVVKGFKKPGYSPYAGRNFLTQVEN